MSVHRAAGYPPEAELHGISAEYGSPRSTDVTAPLTEHPQLVSQDTSRSSAAHAAQA
ncbi:MAG: hypothetical protein IJO91_10175 [Oscillospiraceae bacterium]|nr:hypothetical protein [Oscillospiraceae bacterium]